MKKYKIGVLGENINNDTKPFIKLLQKKYPKDQVQFIAIGKALKGDALKRIKKVQTILKTAFSGKKLDFMLYLRDLDALPSDAEAIKTKQAWFKEVDSGFKQKGLFFLAIYELEALILADIDSFNSIYKTTIRFSKNPLYKEKPKEFLIQKTEANAKTYQESHTQDIFPKLDFQKIYKKHQLDGAPCFHSFIDTLDQRLSP